MAVDVKGLSIQDIMSTYSAEDIKNMDRRDAAKITSRLVSAANKRLRRLKGSEVSSPLTKTDFFSVKDKDVRHIAKEYERLFEFLNKPTSTIKGYKKWRKKIKNEILGLDQNGVIEGALEDVFWDMYKDLYKDNRLFYKKEYKYETFEVIREEVLTSDRPDIVELRKKAFRRLLETDAIDQNEYERIVEKYSSLGGLYPDNEGNE